MRKVGEVLDQWLILLLVSKWGFAILQYPEVSLRAPQIHIPMGIGGRISQVVSKYMSGMPFGHAIYEVVWL